MKAADYRVPWGRRSEHLIAVQREITEQHMHVRRVRDAKSAVDAATPYCVSMPHLITRPKKLQIKDDRQREIAKENQSLMQRLASIMKEERHDPLPQYAHLSVEYRESLRRKKLLKLETENRRLLRSIRGQKPFYSTDAMGREETQRQALLKTMSRTQRRKERLKLLGKVLASGSSGLMAPQGPSQSAPSGADLEEGFLFHPGPGAVKLRTAKQMCHEVARVRGGGAAAGGDGFGAEAPDSRGGGTIRVHPSLRTVDSANSLSVRSSGRGVVLEMTHVGRAATGGRPNLIFAPSLVPVGADTLREHPMSLWGEGAGQVGADEEGQSGVVDRGLAQTAPAPM